MSVWGIVFYSSLGFVRASMQINERLHTFFLLQIAEYGVGAAKNLIYYETTIMCHYVWCICNLFNQCNSIQFRESSK